MDELKYCKHCGNAIELEDYVTLENGDIVCTDCISELYCICEHCGNYELIDDAFYYNNNAYCENCFNDLFIYCEECGCAVPYDDATYAYGEYYCDNCFDNLYTYCDSCDSIISRDVAHYCDNGTYCDDCYSGYKDERIFEYHGFNAWKLYKNENETNPLYFGFELEIEPKMRTFSRVPCFRYLGRTLERNL